MKVNSKKVLAQLMAVAVIGSAYSVPAACMIQPIISVNAEETASNKIEMGLQYGGSWIEGTEYVASRYMNTFIMNADGTSAFESAPAASYARKINFASSLYENGVYHLSDGTFQDGNAGTTTDVTGTVTVNSDGSISFSSSVDCSDSKMVLVNPPATTTTTTETTTTTTTAPPTTPTTTATTETKASPVTMLTVAKTPISSTASQSTGWKKAYADFLKERYAENKNTHFVLAYIDDNDVPELILETGFEHYANGGAYVYDNGKVVELGVNSSGGQFFYAEKSNIIYSASYTNGNGGTGERLYRISNGKLEKIISFYNYYDSGNQVYQVDDVTVTKAQYDAKLKEYQMASGTNSVMGKPLTSIQYGDMYEINDTNIKKYIGTDEVITTTTTTTTTKKTTTTTTTAKASNIKKVDFKRNMTSDGKEYAIITAVDNSGNTAWTYKTNSYPANQTYQVEELGSHNNAYYLVENGTVTALDLATGKVLWQNSDLNANGISFAFGENAIYISAGLAPDFYAVDYSGKTLKRISHLRDDYSSSQYYWADNVSLIGNKYAGIHFNANDKTLYVDLATYEVLDKVPTTSVPVTTTYRTSISTAIGKVTTTTTIVTTPVIVKPYSWYLAPSVKADDIIVSDDSFDVSKIDNKGSDKYAFIERNGKYNFISYDGKIALDKWYDEPRIAEGGELGVYTSANNNTGVYYSSYNGSLSPEQSGWLQRGSFPYVYYVFAYDKNNSQIYHPVQIGNPSHWGNECTYSCDYGTAILIQEATVKTGSSYPDIQYTGKYGAAYNNKVTVAPAYDNGIMNVYNDMIALKSGNKWGYFNGKTGEKVIDFIADETESPYYTSSKSNGIWNDSVYVEARPYTYSDGYVAINNSNGWALYNESGKTVIDYGEFEQIRPVHNNKAWVKDKATGLWGVIDLTGTTVVKPNNNNNNNGNNNNNSGGNNSGNNGNTSGNNSDNNSSSSGSSGKEAPKTGDNFGLAVSALAVSAGIMVASRKRRKK